MKLRACLFLGVLACSGCEQIVDSSDLPYKDELVINATLEAGKPIAVKISHMLPLTSSNSDTIISDVQATISTNGITVPLYFNSSYGFTPLYSPKDSLVAVSGQRYALDVQWHGLHAFATTTVPFAVPIDSVQLLNYSIGEYGNYYVTAALGVHPPANLSFLASYAMKSRQLTWHDSVVYKGDSAIFIGDTIWDTAWMFQPVQYWQAERSEDAGTDGELWVQYTNDVKYDPANEYYDAVLYTFDRPFYDFAISYDRSQGNDIFASGGANPRWNIQGDGIGIFIGMARSTKAINF